jgi:hypothetical protein
VDIVVLGEEVAVVVDVTGSVGKPSPIVIGPKPLE